MPFSLGDFQSFIVEHGGGERLAFLIGKYPEVVEPLLPRIELGLKKKGFLPDIAPDASRPSGFSADEEKALPYLRRLDEALAQGHDQGLAVWRSFIQDPVAHATLSVVAAS